VCKSVQTTKSELAKIISTVFFYERRVTMLRLFVGNIPHASDEIALREWFEGHGHDVASAQVIRDRETGHSRGFAFVELQDTSDLQGTIARLNGQRLLGRVLTINSATPKPTRDAEIHAQQA
jgi:RNA recognition motif-containing protein